MSSFAEFMVQSMQSAWVKAILLLAVLLALALASGAPVCNGC